MSANHSEQILFSIDGERRGPERLNFTALEADIGSHIGRNLRRYRKQFGRTQQQLAEVMGVSLSQYRKYEAGIDIPRYHTACRFSLLTGASYYCLLTGSEYEKVIPEFLTSWQLMPFNNLIGRLKDKPFIALVQLIYSLQLVREILLPPAIETGLDSFDVATALRQLDSETYQMAAVNLRQFRELQGLSQERMAEYLGVTTNTYRSYEVSASAPRYSFLFACRLFVVFGCHPASLMPDSLFARYLQQLLNRLRYLAPTLHQVSSEQYAHLQHIFEEFEALAKNSPVYVF